MARSNDIPIGTAAAVAAATAAAAGAALLTLWMRQRYDDEACSERPREEGQHGSGSAGAPASDAASTKPHLPPRPHRSACDSKGSEGGGGGRCRTLGEWLLDWVPPAAAAARAARAAAPSSAPVPELHGPPSYLSPRSGLMGLIGNTPMVRIESLSKATGCEILAKAEFLNPGGSSKDRVARQIVLDAEARGDLLPGSGHGVLVEGTSGSTGISLSLIARARGYGCVIFMPDDQAMEKSELLAQFGADVRRVKNVSIVNAGHYVRLAEAEAAARPDAVFANQFETDSNFRAHYETTGPEILAQTAGLPRGSCDAFVMGAGTGGTIAGVSRRLKEAAEATGKATTVYLVDPPGSSLLNRARYGVAFAPEQAEQRLKRHRYDTIIEGVGLDRLTANYRRALVDDGISCRDQEAVDMARWLLERDGLFLGSSAAMNCVGAVKAARRLGRGHTIVTLLCDSGSRHITRFWSREYLEAHGLRAELPREPPTDASPCADGLWFVDGTE